ncbi:MAG: hypothetical protein ACK5DD_04870 [Cyclobacteriaceae bacterium]|jgi:hypothetical protein
MAWVSLSSRIGSLPLVLAGPFVRKTISTSVSVWIALKESSSLELVIKSNPALHRIASATANTMAFGNHLHVALITVSGLNLQPNTIYHYDINFPGSKTLSSQGILESAGGVSKIVFGGHFLPSFILPSDDIQSLRILHASCRKPHGGVDGDLGKDAFEAAHNILDSTHHLPNDRPQQLYLTGDQIYADDVSDILLFMLRDAENSILNWPNREQLPSNPNATDLNCMHRFPLIKNAGFTCGEVGNSHLLRLGEFYSMYLFVWSDLFWPIDSNFPSYANEYVYAMDDKNRQLDGQYTEAKYNAKKLKLVQFRDSIHYVRRVLANISTYMIFDDHEITDDWFLNSTWTSDVYASMNGKRIIQNGLSAYSVFQGWGNKPEAFATIGSKEANLLAKLVAINQNAKAGTIAENHWDAVRDLVIPEPSNGSLEGGIDWSYSMQYDKFNVIVLNARTNRSLSKGYAGLLSNDAIKNQIANRLSERSALHYFTLIVSPAPVFGLPLMEDFVQPLVTRFSGPPKGDFEPWSADRNTFEDFLDKVSAFRRVLFLSGDVHYAFSNAVDYWNKRTGATLISKFVNLTSSSLKNSASGPPDGTTFLADAVNNHLPEILLSIENDGLYVGWRIPGRFVHFAESDGVSASIGTKNVKGVFRFKPLRVKGSSIERQWIEVADEPDWQYKIVFASDLRSETDRIGGVIPPLSNKSGHLGTGSRHAALTFARGDHTIVGGNNIGEISFKWGIDEADKKVVHKIWIRVGSKFTPLTIHHIDFGIAKDSDKKPSELGRIP